MIYRNFNLLLHPVTRENEEGKEVVIGYRQDTCKSINEAKRRSRALQKAGNTVRCGPAPLPLVAS